MGEEKGVWRSNRLDYAHFGINIWKPWGNNYYICQGIFPCKTWVLLLITFFSVKRGFTWQKAQVKLTLVWIQFNSANLTWGAVQTICLQAHRHNLPDPGDCWQYWRDFALPISLKSAASSLYLFIFFHFSCFNYFLNSACYMKWLVNYILCQPAYLTLQP